MPTKIGGGGKPQEYDPSNGRYGCGVAGHTKSYGKASRVLSIFSSMEGDKKTSKLMPNYKKARTLDDKFLRYSLDETHKDGKHKACLYKKLLGFEKKNFELLKNQIHSSIISGNAVLYKIERNPTGVIKFEYRIHVAGVNGASATVVAVYGIGPKDGKPRMITNYIK